ncbi:4139_t:CDS:2, partial [Entrophospora sp. SA101]
VEEVEEIGVVEVDNVGNNYGDDNNIDGNDDISELEKSNCKPFTIKLRRYEDEKGEKLDDLLKKYQDQGF